MSPRRLVVHCKAHADQQAAPAKWLVAAICAAALLGSGRATAAAQVPAASASMAATYTAVQPSPDGIGKRYMGREIAHVMGWQGAAWLERDEREQEERTDLLIEELRLQPGMVVADIGAGTGYVSRRMAEQVGLGGKVYAVDVQPEMIKLLTDLVQRDHLTQIDPVLGSERNVPLPASVDLAVMVDVYHELAYPHEVLASIVRALKPGGRVVFVEYRGEDPKVPIKTLHKMSEAQVKREAEALPLDWVRTGETLPWQHVVVFSKR